MAFNWSNALQGAVRGAAPDVAASVDQGRDLDSLIKSREFQDLINQARAAALKNAEEDRALLNPDERKQVLMQKGTRRGAATKPEPTTTENMATLMKRAADLSKARTELGGEDDEVPPEFDAHYKSAMAQVSQEILDAQNPKDYKRAMRFDDASAPRTGSGFAPLEDTLDLNRKAPARPGPGAFGGFGAGSMGVPPQRPDNRGMFAGESFVGPPAPKTFGELGIGDAQSQQVFSEVEAKVPGLRTMYASDPESFQRLFAAVKGGKITQAEAIALIKQSQQL